MRRFVLSTWPALFFARFAFAQTTVRGLADRIISDLLNPLIAVLIGVAVVVFLWGVVEFIAKAGNEEARTTGKKHIIWGLIGLAIMISVWGIVRILSDFICGPAGCPTSL